MNKFCNKCNIEKNIEDFYKSNLYTCKDCKRLHQKIYEKNNTKSKERRKIYALEYNIINKEKIKNYHKLHYTQNKEKFSYENSWQKKNPEKYKEYRHKNKEKRNKYNRVWKKKNKYKIKEYYIKSKETILEKMKTYYKDNRVNIVKRVSKYTSERRENNIPFRLKCTLRATISSALNSKGVKKSTKTTKLIGCNTSFLKQYLESKFLPTMTWENYGSYWHVDHIKPCSSFDLTKEEEQRKCFNYINLQPLFAITQIINGITYIGNLNKSDNFVLD